MKSKEIFLDSKEDLEWLRDVHGINIDKVACAILYGNEDSPFKVRTFSRNHIECEGLTYIVNNSEGKFELQKYKTE